MFVPLLLGGKPEDVSRLQVPPGFGVQSFIEGLDGNPRMMAVGPDGQLYLTVMFAGQVVRLPDLNRDGKADRLEVVAEALELPHGLEWHRGWLYVAVSDAVLRLRKPGEKPALVTTLPEPSGHFTRTLRFGPDGKLYVSVGSESNYGPERDPRRAAILRFNPDGSIPGDNPFATDPDPRKRAVWAYGLKNSVDFGWTLAGKLWATHNGTDGLGDDLPPDELIEVEAGRMHGWPYCYTPGLGANWGKGRRAEVPDPRTTGFDCSRAVPALYTLPAHSAPLGLVWGRNTRFPLEYRSSVFVALHGSMDVHDPAKYRDCGVERIVLEGGLPVRAEPFVWGWRTPGKRCVESWGRPAGLVVGSDGALYISDDKGGRIVRVYHK
jgi:glucose/arabinose dehydrogenase